MKWQDILCRKCLEKALAYPDISWDDLLCYKCIAALVQEAKNVGSSRS